MSENLPLLQVRHVAHSYNTGGARIQALQSIDLDVHAGQLVGLMGRSGSGKTTLLNIVGGLDKPDAGEVRLSGEILTEKSERELTITRAASDRLRVSVIRSAAGAVRQGECGTFRCI